MLSPAQLVISLAQSADPRVRFSLIPLFLRYPEFSAIVMEADRSLSGKEGRTALRFYYTAAVFLQRKHQDRIHRIMGKQPRLANLFSKELRFTPDKNPDRALARLAEQHHFLTGQFVNWLGTYEHAADVWLRQMELQKA